MSATTPMLAGPRSRRGGHDRPVDGQQRPTSLKIALYGSFAEKKKYAWLNSPDAFPVKRLYLNLIEDPEDEELGLKYDLRFLTDKDAAAEDKWFRVGARSRRPASGLCW
ncbi:hypothetical protein [Pseudarthrobacter sp. H2]|uniref:hypothetical protein n=1 Tax=Pseudarthrobacter sp. H2 TaxID=3418415 RepID=UPI003CEC2673